MPEITTLGETMVRLSPPRGERIETADALDFRTAGAESNVAIAAARLGADATWVSKLPDSPLGRRVAGDVRRHGVEPAVAWSEAGRQGTYYVEHGADPRGTNVVYDRADAAVTTLSPDELPTDAVRDADVVFTTGITPALSTTLRDAAAAALDAAETAAFDLNYRRKLWSPERARETLEGLLPAVDLLFVPERDARTVLGAEGSTAGIGEGLRDRFGCETVVVTRGDEGALASTPEGVVERAAVPAETVDPIGTGDAFVGAYLSRHVRGASVATALSWGAAAASLKRTIEGDLAVITEDEVAALVDGDADGIDR